MNIERLIIKNFKNYVDEVEFDLTKKIILLYGANGFGKSTFFDAIEWCLTGKVARFQGLENELKYDIASKRKNSEEPFEVSVTLFFNGNTLTRYFIMNNEKPSKLQVKLKDKNNHTYNGQEQIENFLKGDSKKNLMYEKGSFSQLLKQTYILSQDQVTDFVTGEDAKERYRALANIMGLKSLLNDFDNFKKVLKGLEKNREKLFEEEQSLEKEIKNIKSVLFNVEDNKYTYLLEKQNISPQLENIEKYLKQKIGEQQNKEIRLTNYLEFYKKLDTYFEKQSYYDINTVFNKCQKEKSKLLTQKEEKEKQIKNIEEATESSKKIVDDWEIVEELKREEKKLKEELNQLGVKENSVQELSQVIKELKNEQINLDYNLKAVNFTKKNNSLIKYSKHNIGDIRNQLKSIDTRLKRTNDVLKKVNVIVDNNKDQVLASLISGIKDVQVYTLKFNRDFCPVCSSPKDDLNNDIMRNLNKYLKQLNEESRYYEKAMRLTKYLENRKVKLTNKKIELLHELEKEVDAVKIYETELSRYKSSEFFNEELFKYGEISLQNKLSANLKKLTDKRKAVDIFITLEKNSNNLSMYERTIKVLQSIQTLEDAKSEMNKNKMRRNKLTKEYQENNVSIQTIEDKISSLRKVIYDLENILLKDQYTMTLGGLHAEAIESIKKIEVSIEELESLDDILVDKKRNTKLNEQIISIERKKKDLQARIKKISSFIAELESYRIERQSYIGSGIAGVLNNNNSAVQQYFRYLNPIPSNSELIFEGGEEQLDIKVAYNKNLDNKIGVRSRAQNILSSGQLNVLAISIFLALNKEQTVHPLDFIGIDDPIQNMDDINQYTMCDVLNRIKKQLIISTHDINFLKLFIKKNEYRKRDILVYNLKSPYIESNKLELISFD